LIPHDEQAIGAGNANDEDQSTFWEPAGGKNQGQTDHNLCSIARVRQIRFLSDEAPAIRRDYSVGLILPDGSSQEIASIGGEYSIGELGANLPFRHRSQGNLPGNSTCRKMDKHAPVVNDFRPKAIFSSAPAFPSFHRKWSFRWSGYAGTDLHFKLETWGSGFPVAPDVQTPVGEYVVHYASGETENVPLIAARTLLT